MMQSGQMSPHEYTTALTFLGFSNRGFCRMVVHVDEKTGRSWKSGASPIPGSVAELLRLMVAQNITPDRYFAMKGQDVPPELAAAQRALLSRLPLQSLIDARRRPGTNDVTQLTSVRAAMEYLEQAFEPAERDVNWQATAASLDAAAQDPTLIPHATRSLHYLLQITGRLAPPPAVEGRFVR